MGAGIRPAGAQLDTKRLRGQVSNRSQHPSGPDGTAEAHMQGQLPPLPTPITVKIR